MCANLIVETEKNPAQSLEFVENDHDPRIRTRIRTLWILMMILLGIIAVITRIINFNPRFQIRFGLDRVEIFVKYMAPLEIWHWASILSVIVTAWAVDRTHNQDGKSKGGGIRHIVSEIGKSNRYNLQSDIVSATMTKQSVLAAIASILIVIIKEVSDSSSYDSLILFISRLGYLISILLLLISIKAYDYASRFCWDKHRLYRKEYLTKNSKGQVVQRKGNYKAQLLSKALDLDINSYYCLLFFFVLSTGLIHWTLPMLGSFYMGFLLLKYYFFDFDDDKILTDPPIIELEGPKEKREDSESRDQNTRSPITPKPEVITQRVNI